MQRFQTIYASQETGRWGIFDHQYDLGILGIIYTQDIAAASWVFSHNLNKVPFLLQFFHSNTDGTRIEIKPNSVSINNNAIVANFGTAITGEIVVVFANPVEFALPTTTPTRTVTPTPTTSNTPTPTPTG
jgi:hypothetical protein